MGDMFGPGRERVAMVSMGKPRTERERRLEWRAMAAAEPEFGPLAT